MDRATMENVYTDSPQVTSFPPAVSVSPEELPVTYAPQESEQPQQETPQESQQPQQETPQESQQVVVTPSPAAGPSWPVVGGMLAAALGLGVALTALVVHLRRRRRKGKASCVPMPTSPGIQVGKLHGQGAREGQQDSFFVSDTQMYTTGGLLAAVADGMGGLDQGDQVSQTAVTAVMDAFYDTREPSPVQMLLRLLYAANGAVNHFLGVERIGQCGSTLVLGLIQDGTFSFLSVGDSRVYLYRNGTLTQLNREHSYRRELEVRAINGEGTLEEALTHPRAAGLTSYLGMGQLKEVDWMDSPLPVQPGDRFLLMSDGVYNAVTQQELCKALALDAQPAADAIGAIIEEKAWPGQDNYTAVILQC